jgi:hypothetical protein
MALEGQQTIEEGGLVVGRAAGEPGETVVVTAQAFQPVVELLGYLANRDCVVVLPEREADMQELADEAQELGSE